MGDQLKNGLGQAWALVATFVPKLLGFLIILLVGWLIAKGIAKALTMVMHRLGFQRVVEKTGLSHMTERSGVDLGAILVKLVYYFVLLIALQLAFGVFGESNPVSALLNDVIAFLPRIVVAVVLVVVAAAIAKVVRDLIGSAMGNRPMASMAGTGAYVFIMAIGVIAALNQVNIATTVTMPVLITVLATVGGVLVVGFGGGLIRPMQGRWDGWINRMQQRMDAGAPQPRRETAPGGTHSRAEAPQAAQPAHSGARAQNGGHTHTITHGTGPDQIAGSDLPTPPAGFEQPREH